MLSDQTIHIERPVACAGKGQYIAVVDYGTPGGSMHRRVFEYSRKDPRYKGEATVLCGITLAIPERFRGYIVAISVIKRCLHPKSMEVPKVDRLPHFERVYSWVVEHSNTIQRPVPTAHRQHFAQLLEGAQVHTVDLPYTAYERQKLPPTAMAITNFWPNAHASVALRGVERRVSLRHLVLASLMQ
jgi:hypothetical protein